MTKFRSYNNKEKVYLWPAWFSGCLAFAWAVGCPGLAEQGLPCLPGQAKFALPEEQGKALPAQAMRQARSGSNHLFSSDFSLGKVVQYLARDPSSPLTTLT